MILCCLTMEERSQLYNLIIARASLVSSFKILIRVLIFVWLKLIIVYLISAFVCTICEGKKIMKRGMAICALFGWMIDKVNFCSDSEYDELCSRDIVLQCLDLYVA